MPEYLAPGVYVEEIDTGSKPIEGVSTSTAGMVGVTERGPVNVPLLVTGVGEYARWFGGRLKIDEFSDPGTGHHCYLPHAVEGFFTNGGKRLYVTRILNLPHANNAQTFLYDRGTAASASTFLLHGEAAGGGELFVMDAAGLAAGDSIQIGTGADVEFRQVNGAPGAANQVVLRIPLAFGYQTAGTTVDHYASVTETATPTLDTAVAAGATEIKVTGNGTISAGTLLRLGTGAGGDLEYVFADSENPAAPASRVVKLRTPLMLPHGTGNIGVVQALAGPATPADSTTLHLAAAAGDALLVAVNNANFPTEGEFVHIHDGTHEEVRQIGQLGRVALSPAAYADYSSSAAVDLVTMADAAGVTELTAPVTPGSNVLQVKERQNLHLKDVVRLGGAADPKVEYLTILDLPDQLPGPDPGKVVLSSPLQNDHVKGAQLQQQTVTRSGSALAHPALATPRNGGDLFVSDSTGFTPPGFLRIATGATTAFYHKLSAPPSAPAPALITLDIPLDLPHAAGSAVAARERLLQVVALDPGAWGNLLRVSARDQNPPLVRTRIKEIQDSTHIKLDSSSGVEAGTILQLLDASGNFVDPPLKVDHIDRQNGYLLTLAAPGLPGGAVGDPVWSREFRIDVYLMRQPDPAVPTRDEQVLDSESFRNLSLDPRHSRYIHKIIGTTWSSTPGTTLDDDNQPLRLWDRRSEGESLYIRVRDLTPGTSIRLGPELLTETLPSGQQRATRLRFSGGVDAVDFIGDDVYIGSDDPTPENRTGLQALRSVKEISLVAAPGRLSVAMQNALIDHCETERYRFAVLDGPRPPDDTLTDVQVQRQQFDTKYAALYHPWLLIPDPYPASLASVADFPVPPSGHVLGIYARTDIERGVHKAPANEVVRGITGLQRLLNKEQQDILNPYPVNINVIRDFRVDSRGIRVFGARVITSDPDWKYVNVRRLLIFIEDSLDRGLQWVVFEPNAEPLWARVRRSISNFLTLVWRNGGLEGTKPEEAYFVKCDRTTMTQTDIDNGRLIVVIGVAPVKPAEFVIIRIGLWTAHAED